MQSPLSEHLRGGYQLQQSLLSKDRFWWHHTPAKKISTYWATVNLESISCSNKRTTATSPSARLAASRTA